MPGKKLIRFDWAAKRLLRQKANHDILEGFLSELLHEEVKIIALLESESNQEHESDKQNRVDLLIEDSKGQKILIEVQNDTQFDFMQRLYYGAAKLSVQGIGKGERYGSINKVIVVAIIFFDLGEGEDYIYKGTTDFVGLRKQDTLALTPHQRQLFEVEHVHQIFPEYYLLKVRQFDDVARDTFDEWMYFLKNEELPQNYSAKGLKRAEEELDIMKLPPDERARYERHQEDLMYEASMYFSTYESGKLIGHKEGRVEGREEGREEGLEEGATKKAREVVIKALKRGKLSPEEIAEDTELSLDEVLAIKQQEGL